MKSSFTLPNMTQKYTIFLAAIIVLPFCILVVQKLWLKSKLKPTQKSKKSKVLEYDKFIYT